MLSFSNDDDDYDVFVSRYWCFSCRRLPSGKRSATKKKEGKEGKETRASERAFLLRVVSVAFSFATKACLVFCISLEITHSSFSLNTTTNTNNNNNNQNENTNHKRLKR